MRDLRNHAKIIPILDAENDVYRIVLAELILSHL